MSIPPRWNGRMPRKRAPQPPALERAALESLTEGGITAVTVPRIAKRLGVTKGSFYWHFKSVDELLGAALADWERIFTDERLQDLPTCPTRSSGSSVVRGGRERSSSAEIAPCHCRGGGSSGRRRGVCPGRRETNCLHRGCDAADGLWPQGCGGPRHRRSRGLSRLPAATASCTGHRRQRASTRPQCSNHVRRADRQGVVRPATARRRSC